MENSLLMVEKRNGELVRFDERKIKLAINKAAIASGKSQEYVDKEINGLVEHAVEEILTRFTTNEFVPNVENLHDIVEKWLMKDGHYDVAKTYILYRAEKNRKFTEDRKKVSFLKKLAVQKNDGRKVFFNPKKTISTLERLGEGLQVDLELVYEETVKNIYDGIRTEDIERAMVLATTALIERDPEYDVLASRLFLQRLRKEVIGHSTEQDSEDALECYREAFVDGIKCAVEADLLDSGMLSFDLDALSKQLHPERDAFIKYIGLQTLYERYFLKFDGKRLETPQMFWMRVAMGMCLNEEKKEHWAGRFYEIMSNLLYLPSTPTLFHAGTTYPQLSSCYLTSVDDDLKDIFKSYADNAQLSKWSGGIGNDWTNVRSIGALINTTRVESQGTIPFLKIANDTTVAINRSGKRRGATVAYLETWHLDIEDFLDLRKNTGDERRRTHDMNTANWIPDLFMKRVRDKANWTLFSPDEVPDLHDLYGKAFEKAYAAYEKKAKRGKIKKYKIVEAEKLYRKMISMLFETGHAWWCWKDSCNIRSPQDHVGVVHSSNLCTEITLNTRPSKLIEEEVEDGVMTRRYELGEVATCNLGSINLARHVHNGKVSKKKLTNTISDAMRMLDNIIDLNFYPIEEARHANFQHRPVGLGSMGLQDALYQCDINFEDSGEFVDELQEFISYHAILSSSKLAKERGKYSSYEGSKWDRGIFPVDTLDLLEKERELKIDVARTSRMDWTEVKEHVKEHGMRNSNTQAIAPTATISCIAGCFPCIEAVYKNIYVKANMSGEFTIVNEYLVHDLKKLGLWDKDMLDQLKFHDGNVQELEIPKELKEKYKEAFEIDPKKAIDITALRGKWIDQSQSHNVFLKGKSGKHLWEIYQYAWEKGLKTTYYLRSLGVSQIEKATLDSNKFGFTQKRNHGSNGKACSIEDPTCEACQ